MGIKRTLQKITDKAVLKALDVLVTEREEDSVVDLAIERMEGRAQIERKRMPEGGQRPVFRSDGQVHNFAVVPFPGQRRLTRAQYDARYEGARPEPKHSVTSLLDIKEDDRTFVDDPFGKPEEHGLNRFEDDE